jgi:hypothetical protein
MPGLPDRNVADMKHWTPPAPTIDVPLAWDYPDDEEAIRIPAPQRTRIDATPRRRRMKDITPLVISYIVTVGIWMTLGIIIGRAI